MPLLPAVSYLTMIANPGGFLKNYPVRIFGDAGASGIAIYTMINRGASKRPDSFWGTRKLHDTESFDIRSAAAMGAIAPGHGGHAFPAHSIHMDVGAGAMAFYTLGAAGPNIMVTGQLSGCSFVMVPGAVLGQVDVAHVQPHGMSGQILHGALTGAIAHAQVYGASATRGNYDGNDRAASIIGVRTGAIWRIYAQKQDRTEADRRIVSVYQIYPNRQKL